MEYFETSAKNNNNVEQVISYMMELVYKKMSSSSNHDNVRCTGTVILNSNTNSVKE